MNHSTVGGGGRGEDILTVKGKNLNIYFFFLNTWSGRSSSTDILEGGRMNLSKMLRTKILH